MVDNYDAYHLWLGIPPDEQPPSHYRLLGVRLFEQNVEVIRNAADRQRTHVKRLGINQHQQRGQDLLNEIEAAKICLLRPEKRQAYDEQLRAELQRRDAVGHGSAYEEQLSEETLIVGSDRHCDIVVDLPTISGIHCSVMRRQDKVILRDLKSTNGTFLNFGRVTKPMKITPADLVVLGRDKRLRLPTKFFPMAQRATSVAFIGRSDQCEICIPDHTVSLYHARLIYDEQSPNMSQATIEDLGSTNGTTLIDGDGRSKRLTAHQHRGLAGFESIVCGKVSMSVDELRQRASAKATWSDA